MLHRLHTMDYGSRRCGSRAVDISDDIYPLFYLDYISIIGVPLRPLTRANHRFFDNVTVTFKDWQMPYPGKHQSKLHFDLENRTFRLASAATRETWFIVMHPMVAPVLEFPSSRRERLKKKARSSRLSALKIHHAEVLASYIKEIFLSGELVGERVEPSWGLKSTESQKLEGNKWTVFQERFVESWPTHVARHSDDSFWMQNLPAFHAYDYGANIRIKVDQSLQSLEKETQLRPDDNSDDDLDDDDSSDLGSSDNDPLDDDESVDDDASNRDTHNGTLPDIALPEYDWNDGTPEDHSLDNGPADDNSLDGNPSNAGSSNPRGEGEEGSRRGGKVSSLGLRQLLTELDRKYEVDNIGCISYALAVDIHCVDGNSSDGDEKKPLCLLADRNLVRKEYSSAYGASGLTFYSMAFHPAHGNFTSPRPPAFLKNHVLTVMQDNMSYQNDGADILSCEHFQAYTNIKRSIRYNPEDLLVTQGIATAALTLPTTDSSCTGRHRTKQQRLLEQLQGSKTPNDPDASRPFARERQRIEHALAKGEFAYRMEQVVTVDVANLVPEWRNMRTVLRPMVQLMRFYLQETDHYTHILRVFQPKVFPGILGAFARVFGLAMDEMLHRFRSQGSTGLGLALAEGVAVLDRLGHYCFTGSRSVLMSSVLKPLRTMDGLEKGAWPFIDPTMLDLRHGEGAIDVAKWPRNEEGRPFFLHLAALAHHYGPQVAASRHSLVWFRDLGGKSITGPIEASGFLEEVFRELWVPQMIAFISRQLQRRSRLSQERLTLVEEWSHSEYPFSWR
jgi:hypothetical protein